MNWIWIYGQRWQNHSHSHPFVFAALRFYFAWCRLSPFVTISYNFYDDTNCELCMWINAYAYVQFLQTQFLPISILPVLSRTLFVKAIFTISFNGQTHNYKCIDFMFLSSLEQCRCECSCFWLKSVIFSVQHTLTWRTIAIDFSMYVCWWRNLCSVFSLNESNL